MCGAELDRPLDGPVCPGCWAAVPPLVQPLCARCGGPLPSWRTAPGAWCPACLRRPGAVAAARAAAAYAGTMRAVIHAFKYDGRTSLAVPLGALMRAAAAPLVTEAACVVPVPLHPWRRLHRGFNQAAVLAATLGPPVVPALWRRRVTRPQAGLGPPARRRNLRGAIALSPLLRRRRRALIDGRTVLLVDDVRTTGATLDACARVLLAAGAGMVVAVTAARAD